jgi:hypothetical protein
MNNNSFEPLTLLKKFSNCPKLTQLQTKYYSDLTSENDVMLFYTVKKKKTLF